MALQRPAKTLSARTHTLSVSLAEKAVTSPIKLNPGHVSAQLTLLGLVFIVTALQIGLEGIMSEERITATVEVNDKRITLEGPLSFVQEEVRRLTSAVAAAPRTQARAQSGSESLEGVSERDFIAVKSPDGHLETVTALGFYLTENGQPEFSEEDIRRAYIRAGVRPPKVVGQSLRDAKNKKDLIQPGSTRGTYRLTNHGDRFVRFDLPRPGK
jgi:hypothetical protein